MRWDRFRIDPGSLVALAERDPSGTSGLGKKEAPERLDAACARLAELQDLLYADNRYGLLVVLQGMDASGKDGTVRKVFAGVNPTGLAVTSFKAPSAEELDHDFLWRIYRSVPRHGEVGVWNRSHYEDVLIVRVKGLVPEAEWRSRYERINAFEKLLSEGGLVIVKLFLHISKDEQKERLQARLDDPTKNWKFNPGDLQERARWDDYQAAYQDAIGRCSTALAPWYVVPADKKWFRNVVVAEILVDTLEALSLRYPPPSFDPRQVQVI